MRISFDKRRKKLIIKIEGELDHHCANDVREKIDAFILNGSVDTLLFDFCNLSFMDSSGIGVLIGRYKNIKAMGGDMLIFSVNAQVDRLLTISGIKKIVPIFPSLELALNNN